jgi:general secretion pathway protein G
VYEIALRLYTRDLFAFHIFFWAIFMHNASSPIRRRSLKERGFTLIEIMVVVVIMGILAALVVPNVIGHVEESKVKGAKTDIGTLVGVLKVSKLHNNHYPSTEQGLQALVTKPGSGPAASGWAGPYIDKLPKDPWGNPYQYMSPGLHGEFDVFSFGADGQPGGTGNDADIGSWEL